MPAGDAAYLKFDGTAFFFDAVTSEQSDHTAEVTEHPVEEGANVTDHIRQNNDTVTLEVIVTNAPIKDVNNLYGGSFESVTLDVPKFDPPLLPTPGALFQTIGNAISNFLNGEKIYKAHVLKWPTPFNAVRDAITLLIDWKERGVVGQAILPWATFDNCVITRVTPIRTPDIGDAARISLDIKRIRIVESKLVTAPVPTEPRANVAKAKGRQPTSFVREPAATQKQSIIEHVVNPHDLPDAH